MKYLAVTLALLMCACSPQAETPPEPAPAPVAAPAPNALSMTFEGTLPCADCPGLQTKLTLTRDGPYSGDGTYQLVETYLERGAPITSTGKWFTLRGDAVDPDATVYELDLGGSDKSRHFLRVGDDAALKALDGDMKPLPDSLPNTLKRVK